MAIETYGDVTFYEPKPECEVNYSIRGIMTFMPTYCSYEEYEAVKNGEKDAPGEEPGSLFSEKYGLSLQQEK